MKASIVLGMALATALRVITPGVQERIIEGSYPVVARAT